eukprot:CAMPEP_0198136436 /NCGR_PEP_ID=MMETSP1443-20131203/84_1 /TAXON_ID=186043 /ORGANISM="Entomoneis sp., Strain CCMP2396" /LENGTH=75 /DNA_ID=CAMNT_0043797657 /DNA_START=173 /DNA_END=400 /DNA_ORIENTATION=+
MTAVVRALIASHLVTFGAGFYLGRNLDADELGMYRDSHESTLSRIRRKAGTIAIGTVALGAIAVAFRIALRVKKA